MKDKKIEVIEYKRRIYTVDVPDDMGGNYPTSFRVLRRKGRFVMLTPFWHYLSIDELEAITKKLKELEKNE